MSSAPLVNMIIVFGIINTHGKQDQETEVRQENRILLSVLGSLTVDLT